MKRDDCSKALFALFVLMALVFPLAVFADIPVPPALKTSMSPLSFEEWHATTHGGSEKGCGVFRSAARWCVDAFRRHLIPLTSGKAYFCPEQGCRRGDSPRTGLVSIEVSRFDKTHNLCEIRTKDLPWTSYVRVPSWATEEDLREYAEYFRNWKLRHREESERKR